MSLSIPSGVMGFAVLILHGFWLLYLYLGDVPRIGAYWGYYGFGYCSLLRVEFMYTDMDNRNV